MSSPELSSLFFSGLLTELQAAKSVEEFVHSEGTLCSSRNPMNSLKRTRWRRKVWKGLSSAIALLALRLLSAEIEAAPLLAPGDGIIAFDFDVTSRSFYPVFESPSNAIDGNAVTKYLNFGHRGSGFIVTPRAGPQVVRSFVITTANDAQERDPAEWALYGTSNPITSTDNSDGQAEQWTLVASGPLTLPSQRTTPAPVVSFASSIAYRSYRMVFPRVRAPLAANSMQFAEIQFFAGPDGTGATVLAPGDPILAIDEPLSESRSPSTEDSPQAIDGSPFTKYLNFGRERSGFIVTPSVGASTLTTFIITTANDAVGRDPVAWEIYGTLDPILSADHDTGSAEHWELIAGGTLALPADRFTSSVPIKFPNTVAYTSYRFVVLSVKNAAIANAMQFAEIQFYGSMGLPVVTNLNDDGSGSLRSAIRNAGPFEAIFFAPTVRGKIRLTSGELLLNKTLSIVGPGSAELAISGNNNSRVFHVGLQGDVEIHGLTITEGRVVETNGIDGSRFTSPYTLPTPGGYALGGGVFNEGILKMYDTMIVSNSVQGGAGGGGFTDLIGSVINGETGGPGVGGGIYSAGQLELYRCTLFGNRATGGVGGVGGAALIPADASAPGAGGYASGAAAYTASAILENCTVAANLATGGQGGRGAELGVAPNFTYGVGGPGGPAAGGGVSGGFAMTNCSVSGNSVVGGMGGTGSSAGPTGATFAAGVNVVQLEVQSTIIAGNSGSPPAPDVLGAATSRGWNLIGVTNGSSGWAINDFLGNNVLPLNPLLGPCQDNGGPVWTMCPLAGSPARDKGNSNLATDARGGRRVVDFASIPNAQGGNGADIGALEVDSLFGSLTITKSGTVARLGFKSDLGSSYRLEQTSVLTNRVWTNILTLPGTGQTLEAIDAAATVPHRFYRVLAE